MPSRGLWSALIPSARVKPSAVQLKPSGHVEHVLGSWIHKNNELQEDGLCMLTAVRPGIRLNREQHKCIQMYADLCLANGASR